MDTHDREGLIEGVLRALTVPMEASGRHVHLSQEGVDRLFGPGHRLAPVRDLSQPGQFVCAERVQLCGPKGVLDKVVVLGPERKECQAEISLTDAVTLGVTPPVRLSGDLDGTPGFVLRYGDRVLCLDRGLMVAKRHIHMTPADAQQMGLKDKDVVSVRVPSGERSLVFGDVVVRVSEKFALAMHIDTDESNAAAVAPGTMGEILK